MVSSSTRARASAVDLEVATRLRLAIGRIGRRMRTDGGIGPTPSQVSALATIEKFGTLRIGGETFASPLFLVAPIQLNPICDMLLGADWLAGRRVWISYATNQLFATNLTGKGAP